MALSFVPVVIKIAVSSSEAFQLSCVFPTELANGV